MKVITPSKQINADLPKHPIYATPLSYLKQIE